MAKQPPRRLSKKLQQKNRQLRNPLQKSGAITQPIVEREKNAFEKNFGEGTAFDLIGKFDYRSLYLHSR